MEPSKYQKSIFDWLSEGKGNLIVQAVAGSGKTWTIVKSLELPALRNKTVRLLAFNKHIADAIRLKAPPWVEIATMNSFGYSVLRKFWKGYIQVDANKVSKILQWQVFDFKNQSDDGKKDFYGCRGPVTKIVSLLKAHCFFEDRLDQAITENLIQKYQIELPEHLKTCDFSITLQATWSRAIVDARSIDFDDQLYFPVKNNMTIPSCDVVFVDESQDLNPIQIELLARMKATIVAVGDTNQAIYGFRGADPEAIATIKEKLGATELPLSICYRCPKKVVQEAKTIVPQIEASEDAKEGVVDSIKFEMLQKSINDGDYVLCRVTAPLVQQCLKLISSGRKGTVLGRDIGQGLVTLVENLAGDSIEAFLNNLNDYYAKESDKLKKRNKEMELATLEDKVATLHALADNAETLAELIAKINSIFSDTASAGVTFSTIHKAKGLEAQKVFILRPDLLPHPLAKLPWQQQQEKNLKYVAITRALDTLVWVTGGK